MWYFIIKDGKRIGKEINLKRKEGGEEYILSKKQLKNIADVSGKFCQTQKEYMQEINKIFFCFENIEDYEDLLSLIISIRSPKLSKDFKPTKMYKISNDSLKVLDKEDLKEVTTALEDMDRLKKIYKRVKPRL